MQALNPSYKLRAQQAQGLFELVHARLPSGSGLGDLKVTHGLPVRVLCAFCSGAHALPGDPHEQHVRMLG